MKTPFIITGNRYKDERGEISFNNDFDLSPIKRMYFITNHMDFKSRGWQGHKIESRWFAACEGKFKIETMNFESTNDTTINIKTESFILDDEKLHILHVPPNYYTCITAIKPKSKLLALSNYALNEVRDEHRLPINFLELKSEENEH
jgi:hypothetical protein